MIDETKRNWEEYCSREVAVVAPILRVLGYELDAEQPHITGERHLMQAMTTTSGRKLVLLGHRTQNGPRVVIKTTNDPAGMRELEHERVCRRVLARINFAYEIFHSPEEIFFGKRAGRLISIQQFIEQESVFLERPLKEQFGLALKAFKTQEGAHAVTYNHERLIRETFGTMDVATYLDAFKKFKENIIREFPDEAIQHSFLDAAGRQLEEGRETIDQYCGFLTHTDFVPHNIRVKGGEIFLLDHSSLRFGNKYEGWARFLNFMTLYNPPLAEALTDYVRLNRAQEELLSLKLMRIYRLGEIIWYYANTLKKCSGNLHALNGERVRFWERVLIAVLNDETIPLEVISDYRRRRDSLRSEDEKFRQKGLH